MFDLALRSKHTLTPEGLKEALVLIKDRTIADLAPLHTEVTCAVIDTGNKVLLPGLIDPHVHINEPGRTDWEGFDTATKAAIAGGLTTLVDMPLNSTPVTTTVKAFEEKLTATQHQLHTNCGFWGGIIPGNEKDIEGLINKGVLGFKAFLTHSGIDDFPNATEADLRKAMPILAKHNLPLLVHCELSKENDSWKQKEKQSYQNYLASRPKEWEDNAIALMIRLCEEFNCRTHIVHLSSANSIEPIAQAKAKGLPLTVETAQHYLYFNAEIIPDGQTQYKCAPPIREKANNDLLWQALQDGIIDFVVTDHSPAPPDLKKLDSGDLTTAWGGIASLQLALPVLWTAARKKNIGLEKIVTWLSENPAKLIGQENRKGKIAKGYVADLIVLDPEKKFIPTADTIYHKHKVSPYTGEELFGVIEQTYLNGELVFDNGAFKKLNNGKVIVGR
ncbi:allantoinase AllB [Adhaeribacter aquaticus]|uniref:allantoinase AllB n=1 Tax=Adhaeribacter aquaticus TaxID=299567 RepID=UPI0004022AAE|nr:allantoinase AllB [Adhaeribacter aquaticus]